MKRFTVKKEWKMFKNFVKKQAESENAIKEFNDIDDIERPYDPELEHNSGSVNTCMITIPM